MASVSFDQVYKIYPNGYVGVEDFSLDIGDGEFLILVGPSGCGKSTAMRMVAGLESISRGKISIGDRVVNDLSPRDRDIAMVFQDYALYPHMSVRENLSLGLRLRKTPKAEIESRTDAAAKVLGLEPYLDRKPRELSGGQRQRVALGRAIVRRPKVFLFDEPLSNLDAKLRVQMRMEISKLQRKLGVTTIYVTHDQIEAMSMADRIAVMKDGVLQQFDTPMNTYDHPANLFVAGFIGSPAMNLIHGKLDDGKTFTDASGSFALDVSGYIPTGTPSGDYVLGIRPENIHGDNNLNISSYQPVQILADILEPMGSDSYLYFKIGTHSLIARLRPETSPAEQQPATLYIDRSKLHLFHAASGVNVRG